MDTNDEEWRPVKGYEDSYQVSNTGKVRSIDRETRLFKVKGKELTPQGTSYLSVTLWRNNNYENKLVHRIVAEAFVANPDNLPEVDHKDQNTSNNNASNLEWVTPKENTRRRDTSTNRRYNTPVKCLETGEIFQSISAAGRRVNTDATRIVESIDTRSCCKGFTFVYANEFDSDEQEYLAQAHAKYQNHHKRPSMPNCRKVRCIETNQVFDSIAAASRFYGCDTATITNRIEANKSFDGVTLVFD